MQLELSYTLVTPATADPLTVQEVKEHSFIETDCDDSYLASMIVAATEYVQNLINQQIMSATYALRLSKFPRDIQISRVPLQSVTSIQYVDESGVTQTLAPSEYDVDIFDKPAVIRPAFDKHWPSTRGVRNAVTVTFVSGYSSADAVPADLKHALMIVVNHFYENRDSAAGMPMAVESLLWNHRWSLTPTY